VAYNSGVSDQSKHEQDAVEDGDFDRGAATGRTVRNMRVVFDFGPFAPLSENMTSSKNRKYITYCIAVRGGTSYDHR